MISNEHLYLYLIGAKGGKNLSQQQIEDIFDILKKIVGPKLAKLVTGLLVGLANGALGKVHIGGLIGPVIKLIDTLLRNHGTVENLLAGGNPKALSGNNFPPAEQARLAEIFNQTVGPYTSKYLVKLTALLINGLLGKIPLGKLLAPIRKIFEKLLGSKNIISELLGRKGK